MKKFTLLFIVTLICTVAFGQYVQKEAQLRKDVPAITKQVHSNSNYAELTKEAIWSNDFSVPTDWVMDHTAAAEDKDWVICTVETAPTDWIPVYKMYDDFVSPTVDNGFAMFNSDFGSSSGAPLQDSWIQIANPINLSAVDAPRFVFSTYYKRYEDLVYFEYSTDGVLWNPIEILTNVVETGITTPDLVYLLNVPELGNEPIAYFRFRITGDWDYGWFIDDISIVEAPDYDLNLIATATNFFSYVNYHDADSTDFYHISSHFGMIPDEEITTPESYIIFNAIVINNGLLAATPTVDITITDPNTEEAYTFSYVHDAELASMEIDTFDIAWGDGESFLLTPEDVLLGQYDISFEAYIEGQVDGAPENNSFENYFAVTDYEYARDGGNLDGACGPDQWTSSTGTGDRFGVDYTFFESTTIDSVRAYITSTSDAGTALVCYAMKYDAESDDWVDFANSAVIDIAEEDLGAWKTFTFTDPAAVTLGDEDVSMEIKIALEFYYNDAGALWIGEDNTMDSSPWGTSWLFVGDVDGWTVITNYYNSAPMIRAYITPTLGGVAQNFAANNINMYPNPSTGVVTISNVEGATIEIINLMGQVVATINNAKDINNIDLSSEANGTYIVRIVNGTEISTSKLNLLR